MKVLASTEFDVSIQDRVCVVDFYADWCGPCKMLAPIFLELSSEFEGKIDFFKVDVDKSQDIAAKYKVASIPTMIFFKNGVEADRVVGFQPKANIAAKLAALV